eukprot:scaffold27785_cov81-Phaeocystis_antarctica.AAC.6
MCGLLVAASAPAQSPRDPMSSHNRSLTALVSAGSASRTSARQATHAASAPFWPGHDAFEVSEASSSGGRLATLKQACAVARRSLGSASSISSVLPCSSCNILLSLLTYWPPARRGAGASTWQRRPRHPPRRTRRRATNPAVTAAAAPRRPAVPRPPRHAPRR